MTKHFTTRRKRTKSKSKLQRSNLAVHLYRKLGSAITVVFRSNILLSLPFSLMFFIAAVNFTTMTGLASFLNHDPLVGVTSFIPEFEIEKGEQFKNSLLLYVYIFTLLVALANIEKIYHLLIKSGHLILIFFVLLIGTGYSVEPEKVITNTIILYFGILAAILLGITTARRKNYLSLYTATLIPALAVHFLGNSILITNGIDFIDLINSETRLRGISYNPNTLALSAALGIWAAFSIMLSSKASKPVNLFLLASIALFFINIYLSRSGTSITMAILIIVLGVFMKRFSIAEKKNQIYYKLVSVLTILISAMLITLYSSSEQLLSSFTESLGKDSTLTGRTELWEIAIHAISEKPILGWGYDTHTSVMATSIFDTNHNHYHNGYLDTIVAGGVVLFGLLMINIFSHYWNFTHALSKNQFVFPLISPLIVILTYNISEYTFMRPHSPMWMVYMATYFAVLITITNNNPSPRRGTQKKNKKSVNKQRHLKWA